MARKFLAPIELAQQLLTTLGATMNSGCILARGTAGVGGVEEITPVGGLIIQGGKLIPGEIVKLIGSNFGDTSIPTGLQKDELQIDRPFRIVGVKWNCSPSAMASAGFSDARPYIRTGAGTTSAGAKTNILTTVNNVASLAPSVHTVNATSSINGGTVTGAAGDGVGFDYMSHGTGSSGHTLTLILEYI
jgi:hypothetical protein